MHTIHSIVDIVSHQVCITRTVVAGEERSQLTSFCKLDMTGRIGRHEVMVLRISRCFGQSTPGYRCNRKWGWITSRGKALLLVVYRIYYILDRSGFKATWQSESIISLVFAETWWHRVQRHGVYGRILFSLDMETGNTRQISLSGFEVRRKQRHAQSVRRSSWNM